ncbi:MAG: TolC family protein [Kiritimatiellae bacterium]|nr:TolC family protein [Kiritimatiellia bacterium]
MKLNQQIILSCFVGAILFCGCLSRRHPPEIAGEITAAPLPGAVAATNATELVAPTVVAPPGGFTWEELAGLASRRGYETQLLALQIKRETLQNKVDRAWRDPQIRLIASQADQDEYTRGGGSEHEEGDAETIRARFYISSPFVNRWIKKQSPLTSRLLTTEAEELSYAIYCETKATCLEAAVVLDQVMQLRETRDLQQQICNKFGELTQDGYAAPLKVIKAEIKLADIELKLAQKESEQRNLIYQLAQLTGVEAEQLQLQGLESQSLIEPTALTVDELTTFATLARPDLKRVRSELDLARGEIKVAQAKNIPWFHFIEGSYRQSDSDSTRYRDTGKTYSNEDGEQWAIRAAVNVPIFTWLGDEVNLAQATLNQARFLEVFTLNTIREEVRNGLQNYQEAYAQKTRLENRVNTRLSALAEQISGLDNTGAIIATDILELREQLSSFKQRARETFYNCLKLKLYLESVVGGRSLNQTDINTASRK